MSIRSFFVIFTLIFTFCKSTDASQWLL